MTTNNEWTPARPGLSWQERWANGLFWGWNLIFLAFMALGFAPRLIPELITAIRTDSIAPQFLVYALALTLVPVASVLLGYFRLRREPKKLFALGYVVEGPLMLIMAVRFFAIRQGSPAVLLVLAAAGIGVAAFLWSLLDRHPDERPAWLGLLKLAGLMVMLLMALYASIWMLFYALPGVFYLIEIVSSAIENLGNLFREPLWLPFSLLGGILFLFTSTLFILAPVAIPILTYRAWREAAFDLARRKQALAAIATIAVTTAAVFIAFAVANRQPHLQAFAELAEPPQSVEAAQRLMAHEGRLRGGLLNSYLARYRYISSLGEVTHIRDMYMDRFNLTVPQAYKVERLYESVARPLLYHPVSFQPTAAPETGPRQFAFEQDPVRAARLYQRVFDETIIDGERRQITAAARATWSTGQAEGALQALEEREIHLDQQEITVVGHGDWADFELHEVYRNTTGQRQEVVYYFNLPESAVITGVWLGAGPERDGRHAFILAPRGAAQATYRNEVRRNIDPALVEQIGPRQYRLRVFPIEPIDTVFDPATDRTRIGEAPPMHLWLTWKVVASAGVWPMPQLAMKRNVFWDEATVRTINGAPTSVETGADGEALWMAAALPAANPVAAQRHRIDLPDGTSVLVEPATEALPQFPADTSLAVILDRSRSMEALAGEVDAAVKTLQGLGLAEIDVYLTASKYRGEGPEQVSLAELGERPILYLGGQNPAEMLAQFNRLSEGRSYAGVLVLTDSSGYEIGQGIFEFPTPTSPVWFIHLSDRVPIGYDDNTLAALQGSGGGVAGSLEEALQRIAVQLEAQVLPDGSSRDQIDGYVWTHLPTAALGDEIAPDNDTGFASLAARRVILSEMRLHAQNLNDPATLDQFHRLAQEYGIVTPYSSMIVLVTVEQEQLLRELSAAQDRYDREIEPPGETEPVNQAPLVGVPEPEEWLLIGVALMLLAYTLASRRRQLGRAV